MSIKITRIGPDPYREDEKKPTRPIVKVEKGDRKDTFVIKILHPNKNWFLPEVKQLLVELGLWTRENRKLIVRRRSLEDVEGLPAKIKKKYNTPEKFLKDELTNDVLYEKGHRFKDVESDMEGFKLALDRGNEILEEQFSELETEYEDIKHIPNYKKGFVKLKTKKDNK